MDVLQILWIDNAKVQTLSTENREETNCFRTVKLSDGFTRMINCAEHPEWRFANAVMLVYFHSGDDLQLIPTFSEKIFTDGSPVDLIAEKSIVDLETIKYPNREPIEQYFLYLLLENGVALHIAISQENQWWAQNFDRKEMPTPMNSKFPQSVKAAFTHSEKVTLCNSDITHERAVHNVLYLGLENCQIIRVDLDVPSNKNWLDYNKIKKVSLSKEGRYIPIF